MPWLKETPSYFPTYLGRTRENGHWLRIGRLPKALGRFEHRYPWPIDQSIPNIHLACYFGDREYINPYNQVPHQGVDIQVFAGTPVFSPSNGQLFYSIVDERDHAQLWIQDTTSHIRWGLVHLNPDSVPRHLQERNWNPRNPQIRKGEYIGTVGVWARDLRPEVQVPFDVEAIYGRAYHHLHVEAEYVAFQIGTIEYVRALMGKQNLNINPLQILQLLQL